MVDCHLPEPQNQSISFGPTQMIMAPHHTHYSEYEQKNNLLQMLGTIFRLGREYGESRRKSLVLNQFLPSKECFHEILMLFISWHTKYLKNCKWYFQTLFDFICSSFFYFRSIQTCLTDQNQIEKTS